MRAAPRAWPDSCGVPAKSGGSNSERITMIQSTNSHVPSRHGPDDDQDIRDMSMVLLRKYGLSAFGVAADFAAEHRTIGDMARARLWDNVCRRLSKTRTLS